MRSKPLTNRQRGITLIELVIAMAVTAVVGVLAANMLQVMTSNKQQVEQHQSALNKLQRDLTLIQSDLDQIALRLPESVEDFRPTNLVTASEAYVPGLVLEFSRFSSLPNGYFPQIRFERIRYVFENDSLIRLTQPVDAPTSEQQWNKQVLIDDLDNVKVSLLFNRWQDSLPRKATRPLQAIRLELTSRKWDEMELIGLISPGGAS